MPWALQSVSSSLSNHSVRLRSVDCFRCCDFLSAKYAAIATATVAGAVGLGFSPAAIRS
jgi:hypothetical protein